MEIYVNLVRGCIVFKVYYRCRYQTLWIPLSLFLCTSLYSPRCSYTEGTCTLQLFEISPTLITLERCWCDGKVWGEGRHSIILLNPSLLVFFLCFLFTATPWQTEALKLVVKTEPAAASLPIGTAMPDSRHICNINHSSQQRRILNPLNEDRDQTPILTETTLGP